jgi:integrase
MRIFKRKNSNFWWIDFSIQNNRFRFSSKIHKKSLAESFAKKIYEEKWNEIVLKKKVFNIFDAINFYIETINFDVLSKVRASNIRLFIKEFLDYFKDGKEFNDLSVHKFFIFLRDKRKLKAVSIIKYVKILISILNYCVRKNFITEFPLKKIDYSHFGKIEKRLRFLSIEEFERIDKVINSDKFYEMKDYILFSMNSGMRLNEQLNLCWSRVDFLGREVYITETKTKNNRVIPLNLVIETILKRRFENNKIKPFEFSVSKLNYHWQEILKQAEVSNFRWHDLRHTFASWCLKGWFDWLKKPLDLYKLSKLLGHSQISMTTRYAHLTIIDLKNEILD